MGWNIAALYWTALDLPTAHILFGLQGSFGELAGLYLFLHFLRLGWEETPRWILVPIIVLFAYNYLPYFIEPFALALGFDWTLFESIFYIGDWLPGKIWPALAVFPRNLLLGIAFAASYHSVFYLYGLYTYRTLRPSYPTKRIQTVINLWTLFILARFIEMVLLAVVNFLGGTVEFYKMWPAWHEIWNPMINQLLTIVGILLIVTVAMRYPEAILISHTQLLRATKLYKLFEVSQQPDTDLQHDQLLSYISSFPPELLAELHQM